MASETVRAVLNHVLSALEPRGYPCALMGGIALAVWNYPRATRDVDLLIGIEGGEIESVVGCLEASGCRPKRSQAVVAVGTHRFLQFLYTPPGEFYDVQFDLLLAESELHKSAIGRRVQRDVPGVNRPVDVVRCDDLILLKLLAGRIIDRADAAMLLRENRDAIQFDYLHAWVARLDLTVELSEVWREAYPDEESPPAFPPG